MTNSTIWGRHPLLILPILWAANAYAGGMEFPDNGTIAVGRGGAFTAKADDLTAMYHNPAGLAGQRGTRFLFNSNLVWNKTTYTMHEANKKHDTVRNKPGVFLAPLGMVSSDFGLDFATFALGVYGPSAVGKTKFPADGPQRFQLIESDAMLAFYTLSAAFKIHPKLDVGISFQWGDLMYAQHTEMINAWFGDSVGPGAGYETEVTINFKDRFAFAMLLGAMYRPTDYLSFGLMLRPLPVQFDATGTLDHKFPHGFLRNLDEKGRVWVEDPKAYTSIILPVMLRLGGRYIHKKNDVEIFDIEADVTYEAWSQMPHQRVRFDGAMVIRQDVGSNDRHPLYDVIIPRNYKDTFSIRVGGDYHVIPKTLTLRTGGFFESGAVPLSTTNLDYMSFPRFGVGLGLTWSFWGFDLSVAYEHIFALPRTVGVGESLLHVQMPMSTCQAPYTSECCDVQGQLPGPKVGAGRYTNGIDLLSLGLTVRFNDFFH